MEFLSTSLQKSKIWTEILMVLGGVMLLFASSQIQIPLRPVPITLHTVAVMLIGLTYKPRQALETIFLWLGLAAVGCPVLSGFSGGLAKFVGPTAGYLFGFVIAVYLMSMLKEKFSLNHWTYDALLCLMGTVILYVFGVIWLTHLMGNFKVAFFAGVVPFILPGLVKAGILCSILQTVRHFKKG